MINHLIVYGISAGKNEVENFYQFNFRIQSQHPNNGEISKDLCSVEFNANNFQKKWGKSGLSPGPAALNIIRAAIRKRFQKDPLPIDELAFVRQALNDTVYEIERITDPSFDQNRWIQTKMVLKTR